MKFRFSINLLILTLLFTGTVNAQSWFPVGAEWHYHSVNEWYGGAYGFNHYIVEKDSFFQGKNCQLISEPIGFVYEDSGRVYHFLRATWEFYLLYDINADTTDSWKIPLNNSGDSLEITVFATGVDTINGMPLKTITIQDDRSMYYGKVVEYIGNTENFLPVITWADPCFCGPLRCYEDGTLGLFRVPGSLECDASAVSVPDIEDSPFTVNFNHESGQGRIFTDNPANKLSSMQIYDLNGRQVYKHDISNGSSDVRFDISSNNSRGVYLLYLQSGDKEYVKKLFY